MLQLAPERQGVEIHCCGKIHFNITFKVYFRGNNTCFTPTPNRNEEFTLTTDCCRTKSSENLKVFLFKAKHGKSCAKKITAGNNISELLFTFKVLTRHSFTRKLVSTALMTAEKYLLLQVTPVSSSPGLPYIKSIPHFGESITIKAYSQPKFLPNAVASNFEAMKIRSL